MYLFSAWRFQHESAASRTDVSLPYIELVPLRQCPVQRSLFLYAGHCCVELHDADFANDISDSSNDNTDAPSGGSNPASQSDDHGTPLTVPDGQYLSELTGLPISEELRDHRPIAVMVDNESKALPHYGTADADIVYEMMNSTANDRFTRFYDSEGNEITINPGKTYISIIPDGTWNEVMIY